MYLVEKRFHCPIYQFHRIVVIWKHLTYAFPLYIKCLPVAAYVITPIQKTFNYCLFISLRAGSVIVEVGSIIGRFGENWCIKLVAGSFYFYIKEVNFLFDFNFDCELQNRFLFKLIFYLINLVKFWCNYENIVHVPCI